jgi:branched-subunit amino acid ABC-type transport system permease component
MDELFGTLYTMCGLENMYGTDLADYLWGVASSVVTSNQFIGVGMATLLITLVIVLVYYFVFGKLLQKPSWGNIFTWLIALVVNSGLALLVGWQWVLSDLYQGKMVTVDEVTNATTDLPIGGFDCFMFGCTNAIVALIFFVIMTLIFKWFSRDYSRVPF